MTIAVPSLRAVVCAPGWVRNDLWRRARAVPSLDLRFADSKSLVDAVTGQNLITFTRASGGTFVDSAGVLQTAGTNEPRFNHNPTTGESLGLLVEEQRTNLLLNSATLSTQSVTVTAAAHTLSFTGTGTITLSGTSTAGPLVGTGTGEGNRVSLTFTPTAGTLTLTVSGTVSNAQLEVGSFRTSWIATTGTSATRSADVASIAGTNFSSWYRQDEGTVFAVAIVPQPSAANRRIVFATDGTSNNRAGILYNSSNVSQFLVSSGGTTVASISSSIVTTGLTASAGAYRLDDFAFCSNGGSLAIDTSGAAPVAIDRLSIGSSDGTDRINGTIRRLTYFPQRLPNTTLQSLTQ